MELPVTRTKGSKASRLAELSAARLGVVLWALAATLITLGSIFNSSDSGPLAREFASIDAAATCEEFGVDTLEATSATVDGTVWTACYIDSDEAEVFNADGKTAPESFRKETGVWKDTRAVTNGWFAFFFLGIFGAPASILTLLYYSIRPKAALAKFGFRVLIVGAALVAALVSLVMLVDGYLPSAVTGIGIVTVAIAYPLLARVRIEEVTVSTTTEAVTPTEASQVPPQKRVEDTITGAPLAPEPADWSDIPVEEPAVVVDVDATPLQDDVDTAT